MIKYLSVRILSALGTLVGVTVLVFLMVRLLPGDPARVIAGPTASAAEVQQIRVQLHLDQNLVVQYGNYLAGLLHGDLGTSSQTSASVLGTIGGRLPATLSLAVAAIFTATLFGVAMGVVGALRRARPTDTAVSAVAVGLSALPTFWLGLLAILVFAVKLKWLPPGGYGGWQYYVLPTLTLAAFAVALIARVTRATVVETMTHDYVRTAVAKGVGARRIVMRHTLRNALVPIVTVVGIQFAALLGGAILTEIVFGWPGIGQLLIQAVFARDYPIIQGIVLVYAIMVIIVNLLLDLFYMVLDPRIKYY